MKLFGVSLFIASLFSFVSARAAGGIKSIAVNWQAPETVRRIHVSSFAASTIFDAASRNYLPARAGDGNRQTKWVAAETPSPKAPQWIELKFGGQQRITTVAVFGERVGNDGIVDAEIQIATAPDQWKTVTAITNATSGSWLATFPVTNTSGVRLFITHSSGPSAHTDVYEVEVYGPRLAPNELYAQVEAQMIRAREMNAKLAAVPTTKCAWLKDLQHARESLGAKFQKAEARFEKWKDLSESEQQNLADELDLLPDRQTDWDAAMQKRQDLFQARVAALQAARAICVEATETTRDRRKENQIELANRRVLLQCADDGSSWNAFWNGAGDAAIFAAGFDLQVDGKSVQRENVRADLVAFDDATGKGKQLKLSWGNAIQVERVLRVYDSGVITMTGTIKNNHSSAVTLDSVRPLIVTPGNRGGWLNGDLMHLPAATFLVGASEWQCTPGRTVDWNSNDGQSYVSSQVLNLTDAESRHGLTAAFLSAFSARPDLRAEFCAGEGGLSLTAEKRFLGRQLKAGETLALDPLYLCADEDAFVGLENYADFAAHFAQLPIRKGANGLWCSWYAHRMAVDEELVLANAAVAAKYLKPLGFDMMQLDHGWQTGDVTGDWIPDQKSFPHGFKWLSQELQSRYGLKLGVWIAPTDVAESSELFKQHPDWMLKDGQGKPLVNWRWYWKPNPNCYELDVSNPEAARWMENVFTRLTAEGVSYYKIDFIAASGGEQFVQQDSGITRGWSVLRKAMESVRRGAGTNAWIRYCQPPPLLSAGLADSAYGGDDTLDAGLNGDIHVLRSNARSLAASYWLNDRLYHREVCDMSVRMQADLEEVRMRLALMTLANCSISFSDELQHLPVSRLRMMQSCLPPGNPPMKPLDLFDRTIPSIWQVHCKTDSEEWDTVGVFNFENTPETRTIDFARLGIAPDVDVAAFEFWEQKMGVYRTNLTVTLPPQTSRIFSLRKLSTHPQVIGTDLHLLQGQHELSGVAWSDTNFCLEGNCERAVGMEGKLFVYMPANYAPHFEFPLNQKSARLTHLSGTLWAYEIEFRTAREHWRIPFDRK